MNMFIVKIIWDPTLEIFSLLAYLEESLLGKTNYSMLMYIFFYCFSFIHTLTESWFSSDSKNVTLLFDIYFYKYLIAYNIFFSNACQKQRTPFKEKYFSFYILICTYKLLVKNSPRRWGFCCYPQILSCYSKIGVVQKPISIFLGKIIVQLLFLSWKEVRLGKWNFLG